MININIICVGKLKEKYLQMASDEYIKRLKSFCKINIIELNEYKVPSSPSIAQIEKCIQSEGDMILSKILNSSSFNIAMCIEGKYESSEELAGQINDISRNGKSQINFIIGGSFGLSQKVKQESDFKLSMSPMTFPHQLARVMLLEQIYRAFQINNNGKYHK